MKKQQKAEIQILDNVIFNALNPVFEMTSQDHVPDTIYHYTSSVGLQGILTSGCLHASNVKFMNDKGEMLYAYNLIKQYFDEEASKYSANDLALKLLNLYRDLADPFAILQKSYLLDVYAICFCEDGNSLPQWRTYSANGSGYSIGFSSNSLTSGNIFEENVVLNQVIYNQNRQIEIIKTLISGLVKHAIPYLKTIENDQEQLFMMLLSSRLGMLFSHFAVSFKSPSFQSEQEWRLVRLNGIGQPNDLKLKFRTSADIIVPYIELFPSKRKSKLPITSVIQGPTISKDMGPYSLKILLRSQGYDQVSIDCSDISLRF